MPGLCLWLVAVLSAALSTLSQASGLSPLEYGYPLTNPFEATIATTPAELRPDLPSSKHIRQRDYHLTLLKDRAKQLPDNFWPVKHASYRLAQHSSAAPLIFIIAGTGSHYSNSTSEFLKKLFYGAGMHVVQLSSPTSYDFITAASRSATPGSTPDDAADLYALMQAIKAAHPKLATTEYFLTGYSLGALQAAFVSHLDETKQAFNFKRVLMINPPVNLLTSVSLLDRLVHADVKGVNNNTTFYDLIMNKLTRYFHEKGYIDLNEAVLFDFQQSGQKLSDEQLAMLIGAAFRFASADISFTSDLINRRGLITPPNYPMSDGTSLTPFFKRALQCDFECYLHDQLSPYWLSQNPGRSFEQMVFTFSLHALEAYLKNSDKFLVMHNADDFIINASDLAFLRRTFGERLLVYPHGGHCGNLNYRVNSQTMLEFLQ